MGVILQKRQAGPPTDDPITILSSLIGPDENPPSVGDASGGAMSGIANSLGGTSQAYGQLPLPAGPTQPAPFNFNSTVVPGMALPGGARVPEIKRSDVAKSYDTQVQGKLDEATKTRKAAADEKTPGVRGPNTKEIIGALALVALSGHEAPNVARGMIAGFQKKQDELKAEQEQERQQHMQAAEITARGLEQNANMLDRQRQDSLSMIDKTAAAKYDSEMLKYKTGVESLDLDKRLRGAENVAKIQAQSRENVANIRADSDEGKQATSVIAAKIRAQAPLLKFITEQMKDTQNGRAIAIATLRGMNIAGMSNVDDDVFERAINELSPTATEKYASAKQKNAAAANSDSLAKSRDFLNATVKKLKESQAKWFDNRAIKEHMGGTGAKGGPRAGQSVTATSLFNASMDFEKDLSEAKSKIGAIKKTLPKMQQRLAELETKPEAWPGEKESTAKGISELSASLEYYEQAVQGSNDRKALIEEQKLITNGIYGIKIIPGEPNEYEIMQRIKEARYRQAEGKIPDDELRLRLSQIVKQLRGKS